MTEDVNFKNNQSKQSEMRPTIPSSYERSPPKVSSDSSNSGKHLRVEPIFDRRMKEIDAVNQPSA